MKREIHIFLGSPELTDSKFRNCPKVYGRNRLLPMWAWITIILGTVLALLGILIAVIALIRKSKANAASKKKPLPEPRQTDEKGKDNPLIIPNLHLVFFFSYSSFNKT